MQGTILPIGVSSVIAGNLSQAKKQAKSMYQRSKMIKNEIVRTQRSHQSKGEVKKHTMNIAKLIKKLTSQQKVLDEAIGELDNACTTVEAEREKHVAAIEMAWGRKITNENHTYATMINIPEIETEVDSCLHNVKISIFGIEAEHRGNNKLTKLEHLQKYANE